MSFVILPVFVGLRVALLNRAAFHVRREVKLAETGVPAFEAACHRGDMSRGDELVISSSRTGRCNRLLVKSQEAEGTTSGQQQNG